MFHRCGPTVVLFAITCSASFADTFMVTVKAVDAQKQPVAGADASPVWNAKDQKMVPRADTQSTTDAAGRAVMRMANWNVTRAVLVLSADRKLGGFISVSKADDGKELTVTMQPTVQLQGKLASTELKHPPEWANVMVSLDGCQGFFAYDSGKTAQFKFVLPPGKYKLWVYGSDVADEKPTISVDAGRAIYDLGTLDLKATAIARLKGKVPPDLTVSDARGVKPGLKLGDYKGKWLYIDFWGYW